MTISVSSPSDRGKQPCSIWAMANMTLLIVIHVAVGLRSGRVYVRRRNTVMQLHSGNRESVSHWTGAIQKASL